MFCPFSSRLFCRWWRLSGALLGVQSIYFLSGKMMLFERIFSAPWTWNFISMFSFIWYSKPQLFGFKFYVGDLGNVINWMSMFIYIMLILETLSVCSQVICEMGMFYYCNIMFIVYFTMIPSRPRGHRFSGRDITCMV